jgi:hypothetical protein
MQPLSPQDLLKTVSSKDRAFGEYLNKPGNRCQCYANQGLAGPFQYEHGDYYFCFAKFQNPFWKPWIARYVAMAVFFPMLDLVHETERRLGRPMAPPEWYDIKGVITTRPVKMSVKGMIALSKKAEAWLRSNMIDEIDHRLIRSETEYEWKAKKRELEALYSPHSWAIVTKGKTDWMHLHSSTNTLEMLRQTDYSFSLTPPKYEEPPKEADDSEAKAKAGKDAAAAMNELESVDTTTVDPEQKELL